MIVFTKRRGVIEWAGRVHAYPVLKSDDPGFAGFSRQGSQETNLRRVGWREFFTALDQHRLVVAVESADDFAHRVLPKAKAHAEFPPASFGPPWYRVLWHEVVLGQPAHGAVAPPRPSTGS